MYLVAFPAGHGAVDWATAALFLLAPAIAVSLGLTPAQVGLLFTAQAVGSGIASLPAGILGDRLRRRGLFLLATFWWVAVGYLAASVVSDYWLLVAFLAIGAAGSGAWHPVAMGAMVDRMPERRAMALAVHSVGGTLGEVLAPLSVGFLLSFLDWRQVLQTSTLPALLAGILFLRLAWMVRPSPRASSLRFDMRFLVRMWQKPAARGIVAVLVLHSMSMMALMSMTPLYLQQVRGLSSSEAAVVFSTLILSGAVVSPLMARISDGIGRKPVVLLGLLGGSPAVLLVPLMPNIIMLVPAIMVGGLLLIGVRSVMLATALEIEGSQQSTVLGFLLTLGAGMGAVGAALAGLVGNTDLGLALVLAAVLSLAAGALAVVHPFNHRPVRPPA